MPAGRVAYLDLEYVFKNSNLKARSDKESKAQKERFIYLKNRIELSLRKKNKELRQLEMILGHTEYMKEFEERSGGLELQKKELADLKKKYDEWYKAAQVNLYEELMIAIETISQKENVSIVLSRHPAVLFSNDSLDISEKVIDLLDQINQRDSITTK